LQIFSVVGMALVLVFAWYFMLGDKTLLFPAPAGSEETSTGEVKLPPKAEEPTPPAATGNIDDAVNAILQDVVTDAAAGEDLDVATVGSDGQAISDFGQSYDENTL